MNRQQFDFGTPPTKKSRITGPDSTLLTDEKQISLIKACKEGDLGEVKRALALGANPNLMTDKGEHPLGTAIWGMDPDIVKLLLERNNNILTMSWDEFESHNKRFYGAVFIAGYENWAVVTNHMEKSQCWGADFLSRVKDVPGSPAWNWESLKAHVGIYWSFREDGVHLRKLLSNYFSTQAMIRKLLRIPSDTVVIKKQQEEIKQLEKKKQDILHERKGNAQIQREEQKRQAIMNDNQARINQLLREIEDPGENKSELDSKSRAVTDSLPADLEIKSIFRITNTNISQDEKQKKIQEKLITACKNGDIKTVESALNEGVSLVKETAKGENPLGAAIWGMNPNVVKMILQKMDTLRITPKSWLEYVDENKKLYQRAFIFNEFKPQTYKAWDLELERMGNNHFIRASHLESTNILSELPKEYYLDWGSFRGNIKYTAEAGLPICQNYRNAIDMTTKQYALYQAQIKKEIEQFQINPSLVFS